MGKGRVKKNHKIMQEDPFFSTLPLVITMKNLFLLLAFFLLASPLTSALKQKYEDSDDDGDGTPDEFEDQDGDGLVNADDNDDDGDGLEDDEDADDDGDGKDDL